jgi:large subunit ribosomal protein L6
MSRIGRNPVKITPDVKCSLSDNKVVVSGALGTLERDFPSEVKFENKDGAVFVSPKSDSKRAKSMWGLSRTLLANMVVGVSKGFTKRLEITGVGYKAAIAPFDKNLLILSLGYSHEIIYAIPAGITIQCEKPTSLVITGFDSQLVGQVAAEIRGLRKPEPYKGKGIRYHDEVILRKEGKKKYK